MVLSAFFVASVSFGFGKLMQYFFGVEVGD